MFTIRQISEAISNAVQRGVKVRMIADYSMIATSGSQINRLQSNGNGNVRNINVSNALATNAVSNSFSYGISISRFFLLFRNKICSFIGWKI